jgi:site-specific DNA-methyltransferase (adenine-specific)
MRFWLNETLFFSLVGVDRWPRTEKMLFPHLRTVSADIILNMSSFPIPRQSTELKRLEGIVERGLRGFVEAGAALEQIQPGKDFTNAYGTWTYYLRERWGMSRQQAHRLIESSKMVRLHLSPIGDIVGFVTSESQLRPLLKLKTGTERVEAFRKAIVLAGNAPPTAEQVEAAVRQQLKDRAVRTPQVLMVPSDQGTRDESNPRIVLGDSLDPDLLEPESVHLTLGSPPYNLGIAHPTHSDDLLPDEYAQRRDQWLLNCYRWSMSGGRLAVIVPIDVSKPVKTPFSSEYTRSAIDAGWMYMGTIIWAEGSHGVWHVPSDPPATPAIVCPCESILLFSKGESSRPNPGIPPDITTEEYKEWMHGNWRIPGAHASEIGHPCPFPAMLARRLIQMLSYRGDVVLDPWMGSGTTVIEALKLGRKSIGIDVEETYCELATTRLADAKASLDNSGIGEKTGKETNEIQ